MNYLAGKEANKVRATLRKAFKAGKLLTRRTYTDHYDSCTAPVETPNAPWANADDRNVPDWMLKAGGGLIKLKDDGIIEVGKHWITLEFRVTL